MATGSSRKSNPIKGLKELEGHGVSYCAVCDGFFYKDKNIAVLGSGEYALHESLELLPLVKKITLLTNGENLKATFPESVIIEEKKIKEIRGEKSFQGICFEDGSSCDYDGLFVAVGSANATDLAKKAGAIFDAGKLQLDENMQTSIPGLFAAGDCTGGILQVSVAVGEGAKAGMAAIKYLRENG